MDPYKFLKIEDAILCPNMKVNLIGVIVDFSEPQKTKGTDYFCKLKIIDDSRPKCGIPVHLFDQHPNYLPRVVSVGDIILLSRVRVESHDVGVYAIFNKKFSTFALYEGKDGEGFHPYQVSLKFNTTESDEEIIAGLRKWLAYSKVIDVPFNLLREIRELDTVNLACKVLHICKIAKDDSMVFLWDGTDAPPISISKKLEDEMHDQLPLHLEPLSLSKDLLCTFPSVGTIFRVYINKDCRKYILRLLKVGQWVKIYHVLCNLRDGLWYGVLAQSSRIRGIPDDDMLVLERQSNNDLRLTCELERMPYWSFPWPSRITEVCCGDVPLATLMDVLTCRKVRKKFRCIVRVVAAIPWRVEDFHYLGICRVGFTLEDPTARILAAAYGEDGEKFFQGHPSTDDVLTMKLNKLLGVAIRADGNVVEGAARNPPWVQCCLKYSSSAKYPRIFDTKLVG